MGRIARDLMERYARRLGDRATLRIEPDDDDGELMKLVPRNRAAATMTVEQDYEECGEWWVSVGDESGGESGGEPGDDAWLTAVLEAAVDGRIRIVQGAGRIRVEIEVAPGDVRHGTEHAFPRGFLPAPGWPTRAHITRYEPYA